jgi:hypothetical protein
MARVVNGSLGSGFCPPGHPNYIMEVKFPRGSMSIEYCANECEWIDDEVKQVCRDLLAEWDRDKPSFDTDEVQAWVKQCMHHFARCYDQQWRHEGVVYIQKYYQEFDPSKDEIAEWEAS